MAPAHVFVYGSLMFEQVWEQVVLGKYQATTATLADYARYAVKGQTYPGVIPEAGKRVKGLVWLSVEQSDIALLDAFEGPEYSRQAVELESDVGMRMPAQVYIWKNPLQLEPNPWSLKSFMEVGLERFMGSYVEEWKNSSHKRG